MKRPPIDRSQRVLSIRNLKVAIMSSTGCVLAFESASFDQFQAPATRLRRAQYTASRPICQVKQRWARLVLVGKVFFEGAFHFVTIVSEVLE